MPSERNLTETDMERILNGALDLTDNKASYITNIRFGITNNEVTLDMFYVAPNPHEPSGEPIAQRLHRIIIPLALAKNIGELLTNAMLEWESAFGLSLPFAPDQMTDEIRDTDNGS